MPLVVRDVTYSQPGEDGQRGPTGTEIDTVETHFQVEFADLMAQLLAPDHRPPARPGCTSTRALYAWCWIVLHRTDLNLTLQQVMDEYGIDELLITTPNPGSTTGKGRGRRPTSAAPAAT